MIVVSLIPQNTVDTSNCDQSAWYSIYLCQANRKGILRAAFDPAVPMTRGTAAAWIYAASQGSAVSSPSSSALPPPLPSASSSSSALPPPLPQVSSSVSSSGPDINFNLSLTAYIAKAISNAATLKDQAQNGTRNSVAQGSFQQMSFTYAGDLAQLQYLLTVATNRQLTVSEMQTVLSTEQAMNDIIDSFNRLIGNSTNRPIGNSTGETHAQMCSRIEAELAISGAAWSSAATIKLYDAGCSTQWQCIQGMTLLGATSDAAASACR